MKLLKNIDMNMIKIQESYGITFTVIVKLSLLTVFVLITGLVSVVNGSEEDDFRTAAENYGAPLIEPPKSEITALVMEEFRIPCHGSVPITWVTIYMEHHEIIRNLHVEYASNKTSHFPYVATLVFHSVSVSDVSFYYCVKNQSLELVEQPEDLDTEVKLFRASKTYLFVQDEANPLVPIHQPVLSVKQFEPYTVPCKPSYKDVEVELVRLDDEPSNAIRAAKFDAKHGFTTRFREVHDSTYYACRPKGQTEPEYIIEISFLLSYNELEARTDFITSPTINSTSEGGFVNVGDQITLFCYVDIKAGVKYDILWYFRGILLSDPYKYDISSISESKSKSNELVTVGTKSLTILKADRSDSGDYKCSVRDHNNHTNELTYTVKVLNSDDSVLVLNASQTLVSANQGTVAHLAFDYESFPNATFEMLKDGHRLVMDDRYHLSVMYRVHKVIFSVKDVHVDDTANYTLLADNGMKSTNRTVQVFVVAPPIVMLQPEEIYAKVGQKIILLCTSLSYPPATFEWSYRKCEVHEWQQCARELPGAWVSTDLLDFYHSLIKSINVTTTNCSSNDFPTNTSSTNNPIITPNALLKPFPATKTSRMLNFTQEPDKIENVESRQTTTSSNIYTRVANFTAFVRFPGVARCIANNGNGVDIRSAKIMVGDLEHPVTLWKRDPDQIVAERQEVRLECGAIKFNYTKIIQWRHGAKWLEPITNEIEIHNSDTQYSHRSTLIIKNVDQSNAGQYVCVTRGIDPTKPPDEVRYYLEVHQRRQARVVDSNLTDESVVVSLGDHLDMFCDVDGVPPPEIEWTKDDVLLKNNSYNILISKVGQRSYAKITAVKVEHEGQYKCTVSNEDGRDSQTSKLVIKNRPFKYLFETTLGVLSIILLLVVCTIYLCVRVKKEKDMVRALKKAGLANFEEGDIDRINPELGLNDQADLLPYDRRFEFPRDKLKLGQQLGAGAFGVVVKGLAQGILPYEDETTVAVKMVKANTDDEIMRALISELKIMVHLGQHLNVVNLLGAVTKNIARREVMVIVEYCRFGNVQKFLLKHRTVFVDQINKDTDEIDPMINENEYKWTNNSVYNMRTSGPNDFSPSGHINSQGYVRHSGFGVDSANTEATLVSRGDESERPFSSGYQSDYRGPVRNVTTSDLVCWTFQVARGMDYLASRKVLHGDLAARNILLCDNNVVKICDFGLARSLYNNENYKKNNETPLPFKWLALESLSDQVFSTYSDIWAFGVTMWEFFSLAQTPYPGIDPNRDLYLKLLNGYRMDKPKYANQKLYDIMLSCWNQKPETRPLFHELERQLSALMEDGVKDHYVDLNEPYLQANTEYLKANPDYLAMLHQGPPDVMAPPPPMTTHEEYHVPDVEAPSVPGYINMKSKQGTAIYTPENTSDIEDTDTSVIQSRTKTKTSPVPKPPRKSKERRDTDEPGESIPMLESNVSNRPENHQVETDYKDLTPRHPRDTIINNQYVNLPSVTKKHSNKKSVDAFSNPSYIAVSNINERN